MLGASAAIGRLKKVIEDTGFREFDVLGSLNAAWLCISG
ncbi:hypothetical protein V475_22380 [Sphingobium baderi LL03]|uniref:Uncharacterized protein n=1 Tax=Sphingobium baderi LL03 TaxID=1114964 RepID=T0GXR3_9SPHN|nr:hypothetical protein L485_03735 [Sphingobium baderi LL03]KMS51637.1 hypothetical protein V475_22380 [Sphingobium baderi LL03]